MNKKVGALALVASLALICLVAVLAVTAFRVLRAPEAASEPIEAVALVTEAPAGPEDTAAEPGSDDVAAGSTVFTIEQSSSQVRFELDEDLRGNRVTVVGSTNQIAGQVALDFTDLAATEVGVIQINARTLTTDNNFRNRALNNEILQTGPYEFITFTPTELRKLPDDVAIGESVSFELLGELTIRDITHPVTFAMTVAALSPERLAGSATAIISRELYDLRIPSVPSVANVENEVELYIDFIATAG